MKARKYVNGAALAGAVVWLVGCASVPRVVVVEPVGPAPTGVAQGLGDGSLVIFSARTPADVDVNMAEWRYNNDFGRNDFLNEPAHTDYTIYSQTGEVFRHVRNARNLNDEAPTLVILPAGTYKVEAEAVNCNSARVRVLMTVVIEPGQATLVHLEGGWNPGGEDKQIQVARLPCGRAIGWRAAGAGFASNQLSVQAN